MEYTVNGLARLAGVSVRTLHWYDEIGLLRPARVTEAGYRMYGPDEVDALQSILFYRALGMPLAQIRPLAALRGEARLAALCGIFFFQKESHLLFGKLDNISKLHPFFKCAPCLCGLRPEKRPVIWVKADKQPHFFRPLRCTKHSAARRFISKRHPAEVIYPAPLQRLVWNICISQEDICTRFSIEGKAAVISFI